MLSTVRLARGALVLHPSVQLPNHLIITRNIGKPSAVRFSSRPRQPDDPSQDNESKSKTSDTMSSFGEGYSTRSDEEGFGGIRGGNQSSRRDNNNEEKPTAEFDQSQGSDVKEKERARNQSKV